MKRKVLLIVIALLLVDLPLLSHVRTSRRNAAADLAALQSVAGTGALRAEQYYPLMIVTVRAPLQLPDRILQPGQYSFSLMNGGTDVAIANVDGSEFIGTYLLVPDYRSEAGDGLVNLQDAPDGGPDRIASWFFAAQQNGYGFLYPPS